MLRPNVSLRLVPDVCLVTVLTSFARKYRKAFVRAVGEYPWFTPNPVTASFA
jgi:hypothetical protein